MKYYYEVTDISILSKYSLLFSLRKAHRSDIHIKVKLSHLGADYMDRASPVNRAEKCHENLPWAAK
jgi:hypothetical protein